MISFNLICHNNHEFASLFKDQAGFKYLNEKKMIECVFCGSNKINKGLSAPSLGKKSNQKTDEKSKNIPTLSASTVANSTMASSEQAKIMTQIQALKAHIEKSHLNVGADFVQTARDMHYGEKEKESIVGQADINSVKELLDEGIKVMPLPFLSDKQKN